MYYHVKVKFNNSMPSTYEDLEDDFNGAFINDHQEILYLYTEPYIDEKGDRQLERYAIPLHVIDSVEIKFIYEDNR